MSGLVQNGDRQGQPLVEPQRDLFGEVVDVRREAEPIDQFVDPGRPRSGGK